MTKFKGRSSLKQYMPLKLTKRGIKLWLRCDAGSGYIYDINIYCGKETNPQKNEESLTLGERVVKLLASTIKQNDVVLCLDRFFTSISNRKNMPATKRKNYNVDSVFFVPQTMLYYA